MELNYLFSLNVWNKKKLKIDCGKYSLDKSLVPKQSTLSVDIEAPEGLLCARNHGALAQLKTRDQNFFDLCHPGKSGSTGTQIFLKNCFSNL